MCVHNHFKVCVDIMESPADKRVPTPFSRPDICCQTKVKRISALHLCLQLTLDVIVQFFLNLGNRLGCHEFSGADSTCILQIQMINQFGKACVIDNMEQLHVSTDSFCY